MFLHRGLIRPAIEFGVMVWNPSRMSSVHALESIQRRATKLVPELRDLTYPERLRRLKLPALTFRRVRGDMIETFKYVNGHYDVDMSSLFMLSTNSRTRGHSRRLTKIRCKSALRSHFFSHRVVNVWNSLPEEVVSAPNINTMKARLDKLWENHPAKFDYTIDF